MNFKMVFEYKSRVDIGKVNGNANITNKGMLSMLENVACMHSCLLYTSIVSYRLVNVVSMIIAFGRKGGHG